MGMFDWIVYKETECSACGTPVKEYQSKSGMCELNRLSPAELVVQAGGEAIFYGYCDRDWNSDKKPHCNTFEVALASPVVLPDVKVTRVEES